MKNKVLLKWIAANALGLGVAFLAYLQIPMLAKHGACSCRALHV